METWMRRWRIEYIQDGKREKGIDNSVRPKDKFESQGKSIQDSCKTRNDVRFRDVDSEECTREEVGCCGNEDVKMDEWSYQAGQKNERIRGASKVGEISKKVRESRLKWYGHVLRRDGECVGKRVMVMEVPGKRRRWRTKRRWLDSINNDLSYM